MLAVEKLYVRELDHSDCVESGVISRRTSFQSSASLEEVLSIEGILHDRSGEAKRKHKM